MTPVAAYLLLFVAVGIGFIFVHLMAGKFIRPNKPDAAKRHHLRVRRTDHRQRLDSVRSAFLCGRLAVRYFRRGSRLLLSLGGSLRQGERAWPPSASPRRSTLSRDGRSGQGTAFVSGSLRARPSRRAVEENYGDDVERQRELEGQRATVGNLEPAKETELEHLKLILRTGEGPHELAIKTQEQGVNSPGSPCWRSPSSSACCWSASPICGDAATWPGCAATRGTTGRRIRSFARAACRPTGGTRAARRHRHPLTFRSRSRQQSSCEGREH